MTALHQITKDHKELVTLVNEDELTLDQVSDTMEMIEGDFNDKAVSIVYVKENMQSDVNAISDEIKRLQGRKKTIENRQASLIEYLRINMEASGITKINCPLFNITLAKGREIVSIDNESKISADYLNIKTSTSPMKSEILAALKEGKEVAGASIAISRSSVRIK